MGCAVGVLQDAGVGDGAARGGDEVEGLVWVECSTITAEGTQGRLADEGREVWDRRLYGA